MSYAIRLEALQFQAFHGVYEFERKAGNLFTLDISVEFSLSRLPKEDNIDQAPNYQTLYSIAEQEMKVPRQLLETVAVAMHKRVWENFPEATEVAISIQKANPPIGASCKASSVVLVSNKPIE